MNHGRLYAICLRSPEKGRVTIRSLAEQVARTDKSVVFRITLL